MKKHAYKNQGDNNKKYALFSVKFIRKHLRQCTVDINRKLIFFPFSANIFNVG